jgi:Beta-glucosidase/6-phospho-beta-glucosidase/beta-galactosidase
MHHNAHRLSIEWSRVEPREGKFSRKAINHYRDVILALRKRNIEPIVTLHHFTNPVWFSRSGGWVRPGSILRFLRYCDFVTRYLARHVHYWVTINEPTIYLSHAYILGVWPPQEKSMLKATAVEENLAWAHIRAYHRIHAIYKKQKLYKPAVGIAHNVTAFVAYKQQLKNRLTARLRHRVYNLGFLERILRHNLLHRPLDFIGINYYSRQVVELKKMRLKNLAMDVSERRRGWMKRNSLGWEIYPKGLYEVLVQLKRYDLPVMITENGICTDDDDLRWKYIRDHLTWVHRAIREGVQIIGYLYWSLMDNFEWDKGFGPRFGLIRVDYTTYKRTVRGSGRKFSKVCQSSRLG